MGLGMILQGGSTSQIAEQPMVSNTPCQHYLKSSFNKTGVRSRGDLVARTSTRSISY
jgi:DNA-binding CsgD family transcriptional regulator